MSEPTPEHERRTRSCDPHEGAAPVSLKRMGPVRYWPGYLLCRVLAFGSVLSTPATAGPKVVLISLDGATPGNIERFLNDGTLSKKRGLGFLIKHGVIAERNIDIAPTVLQLLGVRGSDRIEGKPLPVLR